MNIIIYLLQQQNFKRDKNDKYKAIYKIKSVRDLLATTQIKILMVSYLTQKIEVFPPLPFPPTPTHRGEEKGKGEIQFLAAR